jgi:hypothetical protein
MLWMARFNVFKLSLFDCNVLGIAAGTRVKKMEICELGKSQYALNLYGADSCGCWRRGGLARGIANQDCHNNGQDRPPGFVEATPEVTPVSIESALCSHGMPIPFRDAENGEILLLQARNLKVIDSEPREEFCSC